MQNFPTVGLIDGLFRTNLEETGMSYAQEVEMIRLAAERIQSELLKLLAADDPRPAVRLMAATGVLGQVLPTAGSLARLGSVGAGHSIGVPPEGISVDSATTPLMGALRSNELITKAVLTLRKAGKSALEYLKITIEQGRVTSIAIEGGDREQGTDVFENVTFSFNKITVEYVPQGKDGQPRGSMMFADQFDEQV